MPVVTKQELLRMYKQPGHPIAFSAPGTVYKFFKGEVPLDFIQSALEEEDTYTLHREYKRPSVFNPYYSYHRRRRFQADLIDIAGLKRDNDRVTFLLLVIDTFSRKIWIVPLQRKTGEATRDGLKLWVDEINTTRKEGLTLICLTDSGKEFLNRAVQTLFRVNKIEHQTAKNVNKASIAERANKSIQVIIYKYLTSLGETRYLDALPQLVSTYNNRAHRTLHHMTPAQADLPENEIKVRSIHLERYAGIKRKKKIKFRVGDTVRIKTLAGQVSSSRRAYHQQFHGELYTVIRVNTRMPIPMYFLNSMNDEEDVEGGFYANELVRVRGDSFKIDKIIRTRGTGRRKEHFVKWKYFDNKWNSWIKASDLQTV